MARPTKCRRVCHFPEALEFRPDTEYLGEPVVLTVDEFETIRLIDREGLSQEECGVQLGVGRTTAQKIYDTARKKIAKALVLGLPLKIAGGDFTLCKGNTGSCYKKDCFKRELQTEYKMKKGDSTMRIAVTYDNGKIFQHFGHTEHFKIYDVQDGKINSMKIIDTNGSGHGALSGILSSLGVDVLICGGIGGGAQTAVAQAGIKLFGGVSGNADEAVVALLTGKLEFNPDVRCSHHDHEHGDSSHDCGEHGCGKGNCGNH